MRKKKVLGVTLFATSIVAIGAIGLTTVNSDFVDAIFGQSRGDNDSYSLTLNSSNKVSSAGDHVIYTHAKGQVTFTYANVASYSEGHTTIGNGGSIVNKSQITSIESITTVFNGSGTLKARIAYVPGTWNEYFTLVSGSKVEFASLPYYLELKADGGAVNLVSANYTYSCTSNPEAEPHEDVGDYQVTFLTHANDGTSALGSDVVDEIDSGKDYISTGSSTNTYSGKSGLKVGKSGGAGDVSFTLSSSGQVECTTIVVSAKLFNSSKSAKLSVNGTESQSVTASFSDLTFAINESITSIELSSTQYIYISGFTVNYASEYIPGEPDNPTAYEVGFTASDANKDKYTTNSVFSNENALTVVSNKSDGSSSVLDPSEYSYVIKDSNDNVINPSEKFPAQGLYTLVVSYSTYIPQEINLLVGEYIYMVDATASLTKTTFTTADTLSNYLPTCLTASATFSDGSNVTDLSFSDLATNGLGLKLIRNNASADYTKPFGTSGSWKVRVYSLDFPEDVYYDIVLTIEEIPVESITLNETSYTLYPEGQLQLTASVYPTTATNDNVTWTSEDESIASVTDNNDGSATVTAIAVGGTTILATASDGSGVYGTCTITIVPQPEKPEWAVVSDATTLKSGDVIVIAYEDSSTSVELSGFSSTSTVYGTYAAYDTKPNGVYSLTVVDGAGDNYALKNGSDYLYWSSGNSLDTSTSISANSSWTFGGSSIKNAKDDTRSIQYNKTSPRFACYTSSQGALTIYKQTNAAPVTPVYPSSITLTGSNTVSVGDTTQLTVGYSEGTNVKNVTFTSSNTGVAGVSTTGLVTGVSVGTATITATAEAANAGTVSATLDITVSEVAVTSVELNTASTSVKVGKTVTLVATIYPSNATNKTVKWLTNSNAVATVSSTGVVTGVAAGNATITAYSDTNGNNTCDSNEKKATCAVAVTASSGEEEFSITYTDLPTAYSTTSTVYTASSGITFQAYNCANYSSKMQFKASSGYLQNTEALELQSLTINDRESNTLTVYGSNTAGSFSIEINGENDVYDLTGYSYFKISRNSSGAAYCSSITILTGTPTPTDPTGIILSPTSAEVGIGGSKQVGVTYVPANANQNKEITWTSSDTSVATVNTSGLISVKTTANAGQTATITAKLTKFPSITATCNITVVEQQKDDHTVLIYLCGADLESKNQLATGDITEMLKISGQPDDVNIVIETGGASSWSSKYGISSTNLERWHIENKSLVRDDSLSYASMGLSSTLQSFLEYGLTQYPAERTGVIFWNHGGGMRGVCYDEKKNDDVLKNSEIRTAVSGALANCGLQGQKLEWVGYDACLMAVQDIAITNSEYFNYMVASEESEAGYGWDYDTWVDDLYAKKPSTTIFKAIVDGFIADNGGASSSSGDQTLSYMDLSYASAYKTAWENLAAQLDKKVTSSNKSTFNSAITSKVKHYADNDYDYFCTFDAWDFVDKLANNSSFSSFTVGESYITAVKNAHANLVAYNLAQKGAGVSKGICMYWPNSSQYSDVSTYYTTSETTLTTWRSFCVNKGTHA